MSVNAYLNFPGTCEEAFNFYAKCLGSQIVAMIRASDTPMKDRTPADRQAKIMHARMTVGASVIMGSDAPPNYYSKPAGFSVNIGVDDPAEADRIYAALAKLESQHDADFISLRKDLDTVAVNTDASLRTTEQQLILLADSAPSMRQ